MGEEPICAIAVNGMIAKATAVASNVFFIKLIPFNLRRILSVSERSLPSTWACPDWIAGLPSNAQRNLHASVVLRDACRKEALFPLLTRRVRHAETPH